MQFKAAAAEPSPLTNAQLEALMLPPDGWKLDKEILDAHLWRIYTEFSEEPKTEIVVYGFWPALIRLNIEKKQVKRIPGYAGSLGKLLADGLNSPEPAKKNKSELWLRQSLILYFAGFRLSRNEGQRPYAPWIKPEDCRLLDQMADHYIAGQKIMQVGKNTQQEASDELLTEWLAEPGTRTVADVLSYFDVVQPNQVNLPADYTYPISWGWYLLEGNKQMFAYVGLDNDAYDLNAHWLSSGTLPENSDNPFRLWLRDVYFAFMAGKELFESKPIPTTDKHRQILQKEALKQWWAGLEKQK
jgi:hypothetical protein